MIALAGIPASSGAAIGPARVMKRISFDIPDAHSADPEAEKARFRSAVSSAAVEISNLKAAAEKKLGRAEAEIFAAHALMLEDPALEDAVADGITVGLTAESAVAGAIRNLAAQFDSMEDDYFKQRAADVKDIGRRILKKLEGEKSASPENDSACILVTDELLPSDTISLDTARTAGIVTERGGAASHASILARALGIPCVVGVEGLLERTSDGVEIAIDGGKGEVLIHPSENAKKRFESVAAAAREKRAAAMKRKNEPAVTVDGCVIPVFGNAGSVADVAAAIANGAEGIGLFRTEFLFLGRKTMPTEDEQTAEYSAAAAAAGGKPVTIRLLDIGG
ncbi:MAG TPA: phosphoenolpyruvate-utilizing N-terminal domain-containing protein, partial [bacterium]|nr:phosphoenolpyruvate-utilizing N-terminal domain-containing protein [bacterium]